jgi:hypothetical protein
VLAERTFAELAICQPKRSTAARWTSLCAGSTNTTKAGGSSRSATASCTAPTATPRPFCWRPPTSTALAGFIPLAPLHQPHNIAGIRALSALMPDVPQVACFDTAFHMTQPELARRFALPRRLSEAGIKRYGFHGLSYEYIAGALPQHLGARAEGRVVVAHLGNGASMCAMRGARASPPRWASPRWTA